MKAIATNQTSLFFNTAASAGPLTSTWNAAFLAKANCREAAISRANRRQLRLLDEHTSDWPELAARIVLGLTLVGAYATVIWQIGSF